MRILTAVAAAAALIVAPALAAKPVHHHRKPPAHPAVCSLNIAPQTTATLVRNATSTLYDFEGSSASYLLKSAKAVLIVPNLVKVGFIIGGQGGDGVLLRRNGKVWSYPAFYSMGSPSLGLQAGINSAEVVLLIMSDRALAAIEENEFRIGTEAGIAVLMVGGNAGATSYNSDIVGWATAKGVYIGLTINDSTIRQRPEWNAEYYDHALPIDDVYSARVCNRDADNLRAALLR